MESGSRYGRASLAAGEEGAFQSWLGYTIRGDSLRQGEKRERETFEGKAVGEGFWREFLELVADGEARGKTP